MKYALSIAILGTVLLCGCSGYGKSGEDGEDGKDVVGDGAAMTVEVGCASCIYKMEGITDCTLAAKIDGKAVLVKGSDVDAHEAGLCAAAKQAVVEGELLGQEFIATKVALKE
jgi:hypothetical protein